MKKFRVAIVLKNGEIISRNCATKEEADEFILTAGQIKIAKILNKETKEVEIIRL